MGGRSGCFGASLMELRDRGPLLCRERPVGNHTRRGIRVGVLAIEAPGPARRGWGPVRYGAEQRMFFAIPGNVANKNAWSSKALIKQGLS